MDPAHCSFCGKARSEVKRMISGPRVFICDECVGLCVDILAELSEKDLEAGAEVRPAEVEPRETTEQRLVG